MFVHIDQFAYPRLTLFCRSPIQLHEDNNRCSYNEEVFSPVRCRTILLVKNLQLRQKCFRFLVGQDPKTWHPRCDHESFVISNRTRHPITHMCYHHYHSRAKIWSQTNTFIFSPCKPTMLNLITLKYLQTW